MDKNNDIQVNKVDKWCEGVADVSLWQAKKSVDMFLCGYSSMLSIEALDAVRTIYVYLDEALDHFNELEAKYQKQCGMISEYEEENRNLKSELYEVKKERDAYKCELANVLQNMENKFHVERVHLETAYGDRADNIISEVNAEILNLRAERDMMYAKKDDAIRKMTQEVTELEKEKIDLEDRLVQQKRLEVRARVNASTASTYRSEIKQVIDLAKSYGLIIYDDRKDAIPDDVVNIGMCGHYYVLGGRNKEESKDIQKLEKKWKKAENTIKELMQVLNYEHIDVSHSKSSWTIHNRALSEKTKHFDTQFRNLREIIRGLKEDNVKLQKQIEKLTDENRLFQLKNLVNGTYGLTGQIELLNKEIDDLRMENKNLKYLTALQEKNEDFGEYVGKHVAECIREGWEHNLYKLHPYTRIDIHVEEITDMPSAFNHCAIPYVAVMFNNTQTEMERDTAQHECEELNRKIKELKRENEDLRTTLKMCEQDANTAKNLCDGVAFHAERARNKTPWFNDEPCNICTTKYALKGDNI